MPPSDHPALLLYRRYLWAFAVVVSLVLLNQALVQPPLLRLTTDAPLINLAGRQRMLSQRLAKAALAADRAEDDAARALYVAELEGALRAWSAAHLDLRRGPAAGGPSDGEGEPLRRAFDELEPSFLLLRDASTRLAGAYARPGPGPASARGAIADILEAEGRYLGRMDRIVALFEGDARARASRLLWTGRAVAALILAALAGIGLLVLHPATRLIQRQILELRRSRDELEDRVRERTRDLERANRQLEREAAERELAEARHRAVLEMVSHASRTDTLGEMASGLAHELNQPLGAIANYAEGCRVVLDRDRPELDEVKAALEKILATALRAGRLLQRIRRFVTRRGPDRERFEPNRAVQEVADLIRDEAARRGIAVREELAPGLPLLVGDPVQVQQVLINLTRNAFDATEAAEPDARLVVMRTRQLDPRAVEFSVTDRGEGISEDLLPRIFDAYYSTRAEGMGMGLAISRTIVESHGGKLGVDSVPGVATTFHFSLPVAGVEDDAGPHGLPG